MVNILKDFHQIAVVREKSRLVPLNAIPAGRPKPLTNAAAVETPVVKTIDFIRLVSTKLVIVLNHFIFFTKVSQTTVSSSKYASISANFFEQCACGSCGAAGYILLVLLS